MKTLVLCLFSEISGRGFLHPGRTRILPPKELAELDKRKLELPKHKS